MKKRKKKECRNEKNWLKNEFKKVSRQNVKDKNNHVLKKIKIKKKKKTLNATPFDRTAHTSKNRGISSSV